MKIKEGNRIKLVSIALILLSLQLLAQSPAQADSPRSWGYWNVGPAAGAGSTGGSRVELNTNDLNTANNNSGDRLNQNQNETRIGGRLPENNQSPKLIVRGDYVAYNICYFNCSGNNLNTEPTTAGKLHVDVNKGDLLKTDTRSGSFFDTTADYFDAELAVLGTYNGAQYTSKDVGTILETSVTYAFGLVVQKTSFSSAGESKHYISPQLAYVVNGGDGHISASGKVLGETIGKYYIGKPIAAEQIAAQINLGNTYHFNGFSYLGSSVNVAVNFNNANWNAAWNGNKLHNGFNASGNITTSSTLTSNQLTGAGSKGIGFVTGGKVNATLVGVINGTDASKAAVIGNAIVNVQDVKGTKTVGDVFDATLSHHIKVK